MIDAAGLSTNLTFCKDAELCAVCVCTVPGTKALGERLRAGALQITKHHDGHGCGVICCEPGFLSKSGPSVC